ncbi:AAA family ATPase [Streptomyces sp. V4-01]|uniref:AAA family ATPase n=1 Tax=Actinacidiphila polyblastidii TaxID=3110430 RepID=A0ABU7PL94_9ACTN|nr:AAA family ATPase [Streptomyces sp. V4-01]
MDNVIRHPSTPGDDDDRASVPHDIEAEQLVVGAIMHYPQAHAEAAQIIDRTDIYRSAHRLIWDVVTQLIEEGSGVHPVAVRARIGQLGQLRLVDGGVLIDRLGSDVIVPGMVGHFAQIIADRAHERRYDEHASELKAAIARKASGEELDKLVSEFQQRETLRANTGHGPAHLVASILDWDAFFSTDFGNVVLLPGRLMAPGQQITIVGDGKAGKSLFCQEWMWRAATGREFLDDKPGVPLRILYLDAENGQEQVQERFFSFGAGPGRMGTLRYASFPPVRPLDTAGGGADLLALVKATDAELVVLDTVSRFISGPENDADTWLSLYRHTLLPLKRDRVASIRLDHLGKDGERGARGSSAKNQDVDHVWTLAAQGGGVLSLKRTHTRTGIGPDEFVIRREARRDGDSWVPGQTRHVIATPEPSGWDSDGQPTGLAATPGTVEHIIATLDKAGLPNDIGNRVARQRLATLGVPGGTDKIAEAIRRRKSRSDTPAFDVSGDVTGDRTGGRYPETFPGTDPRNGETAGQTFPGTPPETSGTPPVPDPSPSRREGEGERPVRTASETPLCVVCLTPLDPARAAAGYDTHHPCPTT